MYATTHSYNSQSTNNLSCQAKVIGFAAESAQNLPAIIAEHVHSGKYTPLLFTLCNPTTKHEETACCQGRLHIFLDVLANSIL